MASKPSPLPALGEETTVSRAPGTLASHYAPGTPLELLSGTVLEERLHEKLESASSPVLSVGVLARRTCPAFLKEAPWLVWRCLEDEPFAYAQHLYATLRELDALTLDCILVEAVPGDDAWAAVDDRLKRAAYQGG